MRVALVIASLGPGGAERVMTLLANGLAARGSEIHLVTLSGANGDFYAVDERVRRVRLDLARDSKGVLSGLRAGIGRVRILRRALRTIAPDTVVAFITHTNVLALVACVGLRARVVVSERVDPAAHREGFLWRTLALMAYQLADCLVVQTAKIAEWYRPRLWSPQRIVVIPNPVTISPPPQGTSPVTSPFVLGAGRLVSQKGFDLLIRALAVAGVPELHVAIAGEGPERANLQRLAGELGVGNRVHLLGHVDDLASLMRGAQLFVLPSRYEGSPNVLLEALACGLPTVAYNIDGVGEILADGKYGVVVPPGSPELLGAAIAALMADPARRAALVADAPAALERFAPERVLDAWASALSGAR